MIPRNITAEHIRHAINLLRNVEAWADTDRVLRYGGNDYSPTRVISLANRYANGNVLDPSMFTDMEVERLLRDRGFSMAAKSHEYKKVSIDRARGRTSSIEHRYYMRVHGYPPPIKRRKGSVKKLPKKRKTSRLSALAQRRLDAKRETRGES